MNPPMSKPRKPISVLLPPDLQSVVDDALAVEPEMDASKLIRRSIRFWGKIAPQAIDSDELWLLHAARTLKEKDEALWAAALRSLSGFAEEFGAGMPASRYAELGEITATHKRGAERNRGQVRRAAGRQKPPSR